MGGFERLELVHQRVVFGVADGGCVEDVVLIFVMSEQVVQCGNACCRFGIGAFGFGAHGQDYSEPGLGLVLCFVRDENDVVYAE